MCSKPAERLELLPPFRDSQSLMKEWQSGSVMMNCSIWSNGSMQLSWPAKRLMSDHCSVNEAAQVHGTDSAVSQGCHKAYRRVHMSSRVLRVQCQMMNSGLKQHQSAAAALVVSIHNSSSWPCM